MSTTELKNKLKKKIESVQDNYLLQHLLDIIDAETSNQALKIPKSHKKSIDKGIAQIKAGKTYTNAEVMQRFIATSPSISYQSPQD